MIIRQDGFMPTVYPSEELDNGVFYPIHDLYFDFNHNPERKRLPHVGFISYCMESDSHCHWIDRSIPEMPEQI